MLNTLKKALATALYLWSAFREFRKEIVLMAVLGFASGLFGGIGISIIIPLFALLSNQIAPSTDFITRSIHSVFQIIHLPITVPSLLIFMVLLFALKGLVAFCAQYYNTKVMAQYEKETRTRLFQKTLTTTWPNLLEYKLGFLERVLSYDVQKSASLLSGAGTLILTLTTLITYGIIALNISIIITIAMATFGVMLFFAMKPIFYTTRKIAANVANVFKEVSHHINQAMVGSKIIKANSMEKQVSFEVLGYFEELKSAQIKSGFYNASIRSTFEPIGFLFIAGLFVLNYNTPSFNIASFAVAVYLIQRIFSLIQALQGLGQDVNQLVPYVQSVSAYQQTAENNQEIDNGKAPSSFEHLIRFKDVSFKYPNKEKDVLSGLSFEIEKGAMIGIIGPSGAGKTTIADLLLRLLQPKEGQIMLDNTDIRDIKLKEWRSTIGYVPQEVFLLNSTVESNIKFHDNSIPHEEVVAAAKLANIYDTINNLPDGFKTEVGERGVKLSGGQRQRIALARTLARKPKILILDEATSSLDNESESLIQESIANLKGHVTVIVIAHRINTVMRADMVLVLDNGKLAESGQPEKLLADENSYLHKVYYL